MKKLLNLSLMGSILTLCAGLPAGFADVTSTHPANNYSIEGVTQVTKGPYKPGDLIAFDVITPLPKSEFHFFQVTGECLTAPAEWHTGTENKFLDNQYARRGLATAAVTSGCTDGIHNVLEVEIEDKDHGYVRITFDGEHSISQYQTIKGQLFPNADNANRKLDAIEFGIFKDSIRMKSTKPLNIAKLSRLTKNGQSITWVANGRCTFRRNQGAGDNGGALLAIAPGKCYISANTPWGSNLYTPVNLAKEIRIYPSSALLCINHKNKREIFVEKSKCPKGYKKQ